jgi:DNA-binding transcriptional MocR family regulator
MNKLFSVQIADKIEGLINNNTYRVGDKLPSLRSIHVEHSASIGTALQAYLYLIDKGLVIAKEKSGYFVSRKSVSQDEVPKPSSNSATLQNVKIIDRLKQATFENNSKRFVSFFSAVPLIDMLPFNSIRRSLQHTSRDLAGSYIRYESTQGNIQLRKLIAQRSFGWRSNLNSDDIIITNGALEAINLCLRAVTKRGDTVIVETPTYYGVLQCLELLGLKVIEIPSDTTNGIDVNQIETVCKKFKVSACLFVSNFNNPNGVALSEEKKQAIANFANRTKTPVIDDDIYGDLYFGNSRPGNIKTYDKDGWVMLCSSFSKTIAPGYRLGWCVPGRFIKEVEKLKASTNVSTASIVQKSMIQLLSSGTYDRHLRKMRTLLQRQMVLTTQAIEDYFPHGTKLSRPQGGFVLWIELPKKINAFTFQSIANDNQIDFAPGPLFSSKGDYKNYIRISCNNSWNPKIEKALKKLGSIAGELIQ